MLMTVSLFAVIFFIARWHEMQDTANTLRQGDWRWLLLALVLLLLWMINVTASHYTSQRAIGMETPLQRMGLLSLAAYFVNIVTPTGGMGYMAIFVSEARRRGYSGVRAIIACTLFTLFDYLGFLVVLIVGLAILFRNGDLHLPEMIASLLLMTASTILTTLLYLGYRSPQRLSRFLVWLARLANRLSQSVIKRQVTSEEHARIFGEEAGIGLAILRENPVKTFLPALLGLSSKIFLLLIFVLCVLAFNISIPPSNLIACFSIGYLFSIVSPTPGGIGVTEGALVLTMTSMSVPLSSGTLVALAYRGLTFWLPLLPGMLAFHEVGRFKPVGASVPVTAVQRVQSQD
jgi:hypothetical protein